MTVLVGLAFVSACGLCLGIVDVLCVAQRALWFSGEVSHLVPSPPPLAFAGSVTRSLFRCRAQSWELAENAGHEVSAALAPEPSLGFRASMEQFYVEQPSALLPASPLPTGFGVADWRAPSSLVVTMLASALNGDIGSVAVMPIRAAGATFDSGWFPMSSQSATLSYVQGSHGIDEEPEHLLVSVRGPLLTVRLTFFGLR